MGGSKRLRVGLALTAAVVAAAALSVPASGKRAGPVADATIKLKFTNSGIPVFRGPDEVQAGGSIRVINQTDPNATGPQSFSLVTKAELPTTEGQRTKCGKTSNRRLVCKDIAEAHQIEHRDAAIEDVDNGEDGVWDAKFDRIDPGDSYFFENENEEHTRTTEEPGKLFFMSIIYPKAQGKITVVDTD